MGETDYAYAVANIRANEYKLFTMAELKRFIETASAEDILRELESRGFGIHGEEDLVASQNRQVFDYLRGLAQESDVFDIFLKRNDFHNMKAVIKGRITGKDIQKMLLLPSLVSPDVLEKCVESGTFAVLPEWIREPSERAFTVTVETGDGQLCDIILDKGYLSQLKKTAEHIGNEFLAGLAEKIVSFANLKTAVRACKSGKSAAFILEAMIPCDMFDVRELSDAALSQEKLRDYLSNREYQEAANAMDGSMSSFEKYCDDEILRYTHTVRYAVFGIEPLIAHLIHHEAQSKNIQIILAGKKAGIQENNILERMRQTYA